MIGRSGGGGDFGDGRLVGSVESVQVAERWLVSGLVDTLPLSS